MDTPLITNPRVQAWLQGDGTKPLILATLPANLRSARSQAKNFAQVPNDVWRSVDIRLLPFSKVIEMNNAPTGIKEIDVRTFTLGKKGPSFKIASLGATPIQIITADGKNLLFTNIKDDTHEMDWNLKGAGFLGGAPLVGPASRIVHEISQPKIVCANREIDLEPFVGADNRIPQDDKGLAMHGAIFTSPHWVLDEVYTKGVDAEHGIQAVYSLDFKDDPALKLLGAGGRIDASYELTKDENGNPKFRSRFRISNSEDAKEDLVLGSMAQHLFFDPGPDKDQTILRTNLQQCYEGGRLDNPALPTGTVLDIHSGDVNSFSLPDSKNPPVYQRGVVDSVLCGTPVTTHALEGGKPQASIQRSDGIQINLKTDGACNGLVVCNKNPNGLMVEPIVQRPDNWQVTDDKPAEKPLVIKPGGDAVMFGSEISVTDL